MQDLIRRIHVVEIPNADSIERLLLDPNSINNVDVNVNVKNYYHVSTLQLAVEIGNIDAVKILLNHGADVNLTNGYIGAQHVFSYIDNDNVELAKLLLKYGADINWVDDFDDTPMIIHIIKDSYNIVKMLIEHCVDVYPVSKHMGSPFEVATYRKCYPLVTSYRAYIQLLYFTMVFPDLPTYIILWIVDWLDLREMTEYTKVKYIEGFKRSIDNIRSKNLIDL